MRRSVRVFVRALVGGARLVRGLASWIDYALALVVACVEHLRAPALERQVRMPVLVAQAITVHGGRTIVHRVDPGAGHHRTIGPMATLAIGAAAVAATLGARSLFVSGYGTSVAAFTADPVFLALRASQSSVPAGPSLGFERPAVSGVVDGDEATGGTPANPVPLPSRVASSLMPLDVDISGSAPRLAAITAPVPVAPATESTTAPGGPATPAAPAAEDSAAASVSVPAPPAIVAPPRPGPLEQFVGIRYTEDQIRSLALGAGWSTEWLDGLVQVAWCESRFRPDAMGQFALGLMQVMPFWFDVAGADLATWSDPLTNLTVARVAFQNDLAAGRPPWSAWTCKPSQVSAAEGS